MTDRDFESDLDSFDREDSHDVPEYLKDPIQAIRRRWRWMSLALVIGLTATTVVALTMTPKYRASAILLVSSQQIPEEFVRPTVRDDSHERMNEMVGSILSAKKLADLVEEHGLYESLSDALPMSAIVDIMREYVEIKMVEGVSERGSDESANRYSISFTDVNPETAADVANHIAKFFTEMSIERREQRARLTTDFLRRQLRDSETKLGEQEQLIREFKERNRGELPDELETNLRKLEQLQAQRQSLAMQVAETETRLATILSTVDPDSPDARLAALQNKLAHETSIHTDEHPNVTALRRQIASLQASISGGAKGGTSPSAVRSNLAAAERRTLAQMRLQQTETEAQIVAIDERVANTPKRQEALNALEGKVSVLRENYRQFLQKVQDAELAQSLESAQQGERVVVLDRAAAPATPVRSRLKYILGGLVASLALALAVGSLLEIVDPVVISPKHIENTLGFPVLGSVPRIS